MRASTVRNLAAGEMPAPLEELPIDEVRPKVLPAAWRYVRVYVNGYFAIDTTGLKVIGTFARESDGKRWLHVSASREDRLPSWDDLRAVKDVFVGPDRVAYQVLPRREDYVNLHPHVLHLWCPVDGPVTPDFRRGGEAI